MIAATAARAILSLQPPPRIDRILDFGCGDGRSISEIARRLRVRRAFGLDRDEAAVRAARERGVAVVLADVFRPPFRPGSFDLAHEYGVTEFLGDLSPLVDAMLRSVRQGGHVLLQYGNPASLGRLWSLDVARAGRRVQYHVARPEGIVAILIRARVRHSLVGLRPIGRVYATEAWQRRLGWIPAPGWAFLDLLARLARFPPVALYAHLQREPNGLSAGDPAE